MNTENSKETMPELLEKSTLRNFQDIELRAKALRVLSEKSTWRWVLIYIPGLGLIQYFIPHILKLFDLRLSSLDQAILFALAASIPALWAQVILLQRRLDAATQLLQFNEKMAERIDSSL